MAMCGSECEVKMSWLARDWGKPGGLVTIGGVFGIEVPTKKVKLPVVLVAVAKATAAT
jgi:hypothetical protein